MTGVSIGPMAFGRSPRICRPLIQGYPSASQSVGDILIKAFAHNRGYSVVAFAILL